MKKSNIIHKIAITFSSLLLGTLPAFAQTQAAEPSSSFVLDANTVLVLTAALLLLVIAVLGYTLLASIDLYKKRKNEGNKQSGQAAKTLLLVLVLLGTLSALAQQGAEAAAAPAAGVFSDAKILRYLLFAVIGLELITIFGMVYWIRYFTGIADLEKEKAVERKEKLKDASSWWSRINKLKPMEEESSLDVGHSYDGIKELDNVTPPWFTIAFIITIIFGLGYLWRYHVANAAPGQYEEYEISVTKANLAKEAYLKLKGDAVNESTVTMVDAAGIDAGKKLYISNCVACHGNELQGGVGPNLVDDYWIHGGKLGDIFKIIKLGVVEKGMMSWKDVFSADQIAQIASFIKSEHGKKPTGAKEPQGELYKDNTTPTPDAPQKDSTTSIAKL